MFSWHHSRFTNTNNIVNPYNLKILNQYDGRYYILISTVTIFNIMADIIY